MPNESTIYCLGIKTLFSNFAATFGRQFSSGLIQLLSVALIARFYGPEGNGAYAVVLLVPNLLSTFLNLGIGSANVYFIGSGKFSSRKVFLTTLSFALFIGTLGLLIGSLFIIYGTKTFFPNIDPLMLWIALASFPPILLQNLVVSILQGEQRFKEFNIVLFSQPLFNLIILLFFIILSIKAFFYLVIAHFLSVIFSILLSFYFIINYSGNNFKGSTLNYFKAAFSYGIKAHLSNILAFIIYKADIFLVNLLINPYSAGIYVISVQLSERLWMLSQTLSVVLLPRLSQLSTDIDKSTAVTEGISKIVFFITLLGAIAFVIFAYPLIYIIFGSQYIEAFFPLIYLLPGIISGSSSRIIANYFASRGKPEINMYVSFIVVIINIFGNIALIPSWGINGAAIATSFSYMFNLIMKLIIFKTITKSSFFGPIILTKKDFKDIFTFLIQKIKWIYNFF